MDGRDHALGGASWLRDDPIDAIAARAGIGRVRSVSRARGGSSGSTVVVVSDKGKRVVRAVANVAFGSAGRVAGVFDLQSVRQQPWFSGTDFHEWADPLPAGAVVRTEAALREK